MSCLFYHFYPLSEDGDVYVWGYGILGKGPNVDQSERPTLIPPALFGRNEFNPEVRIKDIKCGINYFAALLGKTLMCIFLMTSKHFCIMVIKIHTHLTRGGGGWSQYMSDTDTLQACFVTELCLCVQEI